MSQKKVVETFDRWAAEGRDAGMEESHGDVVEQAIERMQIQAGEKILDLGCGNGWATRKLAQSNAGVQAIGVDASPQMIARADELHSFTIRARYDYQSFEDLELGDASFDRVFSMEALYYSADLEKALSEVLRVLKPGGRAEILVDFYEESAASASWPEDLGLELHRLSEAGWAEAFRNAGFSEVSTERLHDRREHGDASEDKRALKEAGTLWIRAVK